MTEILTEPASAPNVWRGDELADVGRWVIRFTEEDFADFERALAHVSKNSPRTRSPASCISTRCRRGQASLLACKLQTGDLQFINNFVTVHTRTAFVDDAEDPARRRHLLRLWISRPEAGRPLCPEYAVWRSGYPM